MEMLLRFIKDIQVSINIELCSFLLLLFSLDCINLFCYELFFQLCAVFYNPEKIFACKFSEPYSQACSGNVWANICLGL